MRICTFIITLLFSAFIATAQDTFSIVAVDTITGETGSAGASCIDNTAIAGGAKIISDIIPGRGAIHTQSYWLSANQVNAHNRMLAGDSPQQIIDWLVANDAQNLPGRRQYGIVDFDNEGQARSAAFTGQQSMDWKGHKTGSNYAIQGNILLNAGILDSIEARFLRTEGSLSDKLMAALQGANVPGADSRCLSEGVSSLSAFIRMARTNDHPDTLFLDLNVPQTPYGVEPIDSLQQLYDNWKMITSLLDHSDTKNTNWHIFPNPSKGVSTIDLSEMKVKIATISIYSQKGKLLKVLKNPLQMQKLELETTGKGLYYVVLSGEQSVRFIKKLIIN